MFRIIPLRTSLWRAGAVILALSLVASLVGASTDRLTSPGIVLAPPSNSRCWVALAIVYTIILVGGWLCANQTWSRWRQRGLAQSVTVAETPSTRVRWTWTMKQVFAGVLVLVVGIWLASVVAETVEGAFGLMVGVAVPLGIVGTEYLLLARRVGKLEQERGVVYYWRRQPRFDDFQRTGVYAVPAYAALR